MADAKRGTVGRVVAAVVGVIAVAAVFVGALVGGVMLHSGTPAVRRLVLTQVNRSLAGALRGTLEIAGMRRFGLSGVTGVDVIVRDPEGRVVLTADGVTLRIGVPALAWAALRGGGAIPVVVTDASIRRVEATLIRGADGKPTLVHAFEPRHPSPAPAPAQAKTSRGVSVEVRALRVARAFAHGQVASFDHLFAEIDDLAGSFARDASGTTANVQHLALDVRGVLPRPVEATLSAHAALPAQGGRTVSASVDGGLEGVPVSVRATMFGQTVDATVLAQPGGGSVDLEAAADLGETKTVNATLLVTGVDPHGVLASAPVTRVDARARAHARIAPGGALTGDATLHTDATRIASQLVPGVDGEATFTQARASGTLHVDEPGAPADVRFDVRRHRGETTVAFDAHAHVRDLALLPQLRGREAGGEADVKADGQVRLGRDTVDAGFEARLAGAHVGGDAVRSATARARVQGALNAPCGRVRVRAVGVRAAGETVDSVSVDVTGPVRAPTVTASLRGGSLPAVDAQATLAFGHGVRAQRVAVRVSRNATTVTARAASVRAGGGRVDVTGLKIDGVGAPVRGDAHLARGAVAVRLQAPDVDVPAVMRFFGRRDVTGGRATLDADVRADARRATGHLDGSLTALGLHGIGREDARIALKLAGRRVDGGAWASLDGAQSRVTLRNLVLGGPPGEPRAWEHATGAIDLVAAVDLAKLRELLPADSGLFEQMGGQVELRAQVERARPAGTPDARVDLSTHGLVLVARQSARAPPPSHIVRPEEPKPPKQPFCTSGVDVQVAATVQGASNRVTVDGALLDRLGPIAKLRLQTTAPLAELAHAPDRAAALMERAPLEAHVQVPPRELADWPEVLRPMAVRGRLDATLDVKGRVVDPRVHLQAHAMGVASMPSRSALPFDGTVDATYDGRAAIARVIAKRREQVVLDVRADADAPIGQWLRPPPGGPAWDAGATVALHGFPLEGVPPIAVRGVGGRATGVVNLEGLHRDARVDADIRLERPRLGVVCFQDGVVWLRIDRQRLAAATRFERPGSFAAASVDAAVRWGSRIAPSLDASRPIDGTLQTRDLRAAALMPFLRGVVNDIDGRIDAGVRVHVNPDLKTGTFDGGIVLSDGLLEIPALGEPLHGVGARVTVRPWGTLRVDDITAQGPTGKLTGSALVLLDGAKLRSATADIDIPRGDRMPLTVEGVPLGEASGHVHAEATMVEQRNTLDVTVNVPQLQMDLPSTSGRSLQSLDPAPHVLIGMYQPPTGRFVILPQHAPEKPRAPGSLAIHAVVDLGKEVRIKRDANLDVYLTGQPVLDVTDKFQATGTIHLVRGTVDVFGKRFTIEPSSTVAFTGDTSNPQLVVTALDVAPDGTRIFADVIGTPEKMKVTLRSEPPLPQDEILGLLLFGSPEGLAGTPAPGEQPDPTQRAVGLASGIVTQGINQALSGITTLQVSTRVDTSQAANPRPELDVRVTNDVLARITVQTGMPAPGQPPDRTLLTVDWRFKPQWSLQSTVGDEGTTLFDLLWHRQY